MAGAPGESGMRVIRIRGEVNETQEDIEVPQRKGCFPTCVHIAVWVHRKSSHMEPYVRYQGEKKMQEKNQNKPKHSILLNAACRPVRREGGRNPLMQFAWLKPSLAHGDSLQGGQEEHPLLPVLPGEGPAAARARYLLPTTAPIKHSGGNYSWQHCNYGDSRPNRKCRLCFPVLIRAALGRRRGKNEHFHGNIFWSLHFRVIAWVSVLLFCTPAPMAW